MKAFVFACIAAVVIAIIGAIVLGGMQESADRIFKFGRAPWPLICSGFIEML